MSNNRLIQSMVAAMATFIAALGWLGLSNFLSGRGFWYWPTAAFFILLVFWSLSLLCTKSKMVIFVNLSLIWASFLLSFGFKLEYLAALIIALLFSYFGSLRAINDLETRIKIQPTLIFKRGMPYFMTGLCLVIATAFYFSPLALEGKNQLLIPRPLFHILVQPIIITLENQMSSQEILENLSERFNLPLSDFTMDQAGMEEMFYQAMNQQINQYSQTHQSYFLLGLAIGLFFSLRAIAVLFGWLVIFFSWLIFKILLINGAIKIQQKAVLQEVME